MRILQRAPRELQKETAWSAERLSALRTLLPLPVLMFTSGCRYSSRERNEKKARSTTGRRVPFLVWRHNWSCRVTL